MDKKCKKKCILPQICNKETGRCKKFLSGTSPATSKNNFKNHGVITISVPEIIHLLPELQKEFISTCNDFPEFKNNSSKQYVLGGFSALGNPSSFHNPLVRKLRQWCMVAVLPYMRFLSEGRKLEQTFDRMMYRPAGLSPTSESWHRDEAPLALDDDITFGGWLNLDSTSQWFSCVEKTHSLKGIHKGGFKKVNKQQVLKDEKKRIEVLPGHILLFYETILHEVLSVKKTFDSMRLFLGWRLTYNDKPLYASNIDTTKNFSVPRLKSGQIPPMYSNMHWINWLNELESFSQKRMIDKCLHQLYRNSTKTTHTVVMRFLPSLVDLKLQTPPKYESHEIHMLIPHKSWKLLIPGETKKYKKYKL